MFKIKYLLVAVLLTLAAPVFAGGWAAIQLDAPLTDINAGEVTRIGFTVYQHGYNAVHELMWEGKKVMIEPQLTFTNAATREKVEATAVHTGDVGHFVAEVVFPNAGEWRMEVTTEPLLTETKFEPLSVAAAATAAEQPAAQPVVKTEVQPAVQTAPQPAPQAEPTSNLLIYGLVALLAVILLSGGGLWWLSRTARTPQIARPQ